MLMRNKMKPISSLITCLFLLTLTHAQSLSPEVVAPAGDRFFGTDVSVSWTLGEVMVESYETTTIVLSQGFQQGSLSSTSIEDLFASFGQIRVFPIPTRQTLRIEWEHGQHALQVRLSDLRGRDLMRKSFRDLYGELDLSHLAEGVYLLHLSDGKHLGKTVRIQKESQ